MSQWKTYSTKDLIAGGKLIINDGYRAKNKELGPSGIPFVRAGNLLNDGFKLDDADRFPEENINKVGIKVSKPGDVVLTTKGTVGRFAFVRDDTEKLLYAPQLSFWRVIDKDAIEPRFLYFWMRGQEFQIQCNRVKGQTDMADFVSLTEQRQMEITLPPLPTQQRIAQILGRLDDKIEVNRRSSRTLEAMVQALYKHWFVDYGPFQDGPFVESELGLIPQGWRVGKLGDIARNVKQNVDPSELLPETPYIGLDDMPKDGIITLDTWGEVGEIVSTKSLMKKGQFLFGKLRPYFKKVGVVPIDGVSSTDILVIEPKEDAFYAMILSLIGTQEFVGYTDAVSSGTRMPRVSWQMMTKYQTVIPDICIAQEFNRIVKPWVEIINQKIVENRKLAEIRDYLLPKLLSGEISVWTNYG